MGTDKQTDKLMDKYYSILRDKLSLPDGSSVCSIPLCSPGGLDSNKFDTMEDMFHIQVEDELFGED
jgi:hypothetical protein